MESSNLCYIYDLIYIYDIMMPNSKMATAHPQFNLYLLPLHALPSQLDFVITNQVSIYLKTCMFHKEYIINKPKNRSK